MEINYDTLISALSWTLVHSLWQGLLLAATGAMVLTLAKKAQPQVRYNLMC